MSRVHLTDKYVIMHGERPAAEISPAGFCSIYDEERLPYDLYLEETDHNDIDLQIQNLDNF